MISASRFVVHICGSDFVAITWHGDAYFVRDFERVFRNEKSFSEITLRVDMDAPVMNLAFDHERALIQTVC